MSPRSTICLRSQTRRSHAASQERPMVMVLKQTIWVRVNQHPVLDPWCIISRRRDSGQQKMPLRNLQLRLPPQMNVRKNLWRLHNSRRNPTLSLTMTTCCLTTVRKKRGPYSNPQLQPLLLTNLINQLQPLQLIPTTLLQQLTLNLLPLPPQWLTTQVPMRSPLKQQTSEACNNRAQLVEVVLWAAADKRNQELSRVPPLIPWWREVILRMIIPHLLQQQLHSSNHLLVIIRSTLLPLAEVALPIKLHSTQCKAPLSLRNNNSSQLPHPGSLQSKKTLKLLLILNLPLPPPPLQHHLGLLRTKPLTPPLLRSSRRTLLVMGWTIS